MIEYFIRIDEDGIPDTQSYYDNGRRMTRFYSKQNAEWHLFNYYKSDENSEELSNWLDKHIVETEPGVWGLPTEPGILFGFLLTPGKERDLTMAAFIMYLYPGYYVQVFEGIPINDYNPARKAQHKDGHQFIPIKMIGSYKAPDDKNDYSRVFTKWLEDKNFTVSPFEMEKL